MPITGLLIDAGVTWSNTQYDDHPISNKLGQSLEGKRYPLRRSGLPPALFPTKCLSAVIPGSGLSTPSYMGDHNTNETLEPEAEVGSYTIVNARLGLRTNDAGWGVLGLGEEYL
ncbi:MAG: hypothetical protein R3E64_09420 [Halioglobus sp.]